MPVQKSKLEMTPAQIAFIDRVGAAAVDKIAEIVFGYVDLVDQGADDRARDGYRRTHDISAAFGEEAQAYLSARLSDLEECWARVGVAAESGRLAQTRNSNS